MEQPGWVGWWLGGHGLEGGVGLAGGWGAVGCTVGRNGLEGRIRGWGG